ncbi:hairy-related 8.2 [Austrofundulus limnaeus]|uniref:Hairy-related 8.2 n=1 Tax=Austrofundulus limnaeus TaxID=52670 RepID=A0A2I4BRT3_AUSLI|nr:PREDICTED: transcription cofactor HES-6-like [Austrofundulus limnaeus]
MTASASQPTAKEERKLRKPLIERKRRERINNCLDQLKETVIGAFRLDQSKLEKADILEMTVKHLQNIQNHKLKDPGAGLEAQQRYSTGYIQCMHEVHNMLLTCDWMDKTLSSRLLNHLLKSLPRSSDELTHQDTPLSSGQGTLGTPHLGGRKHQREGATCHKAGLQERLHSSHPHLGVLEMWRPW